MTGDTVVCEKDIFDPQSPTSPTSPTATEDSGATLRGDGDAIINIAEEHDGSTTRSSSETRTDIKIETDEKRRPTIFKRITSHLKSDPEPEAVTETKTRKLEEIPNGYPRLAAFQSSEANFSLYRSFSYLHSRVLLDLQEEIRCLENELDEIDWDDFDENPERLRSREDDVSAAAAEGTTRTRRVILKEIHTKLLEYDRLLIKARTLETFQKPSDRNYRSVRRYYNNTKPLTDVETNSIRSREDVVSLRSGREWVSFDAGIENIIFRLDGFLQKILRLQEPPLLKYFRTPELRAKTDNKYISYYSSTRIDKLINILITFVIFILLIIPVVTMYHLTSTTMIGLPDDNQNGTAITNIETRTSQSAPFNQRDTFNAVGVLIVFTLLFSAAMSMLTKAARHELFAASAAYCAILVVFIGNFTGPGN
ncbi:hypothetical protein B0J11DRAFT_423338 [Dendryphion nanum]|uniref:DUF6594 domain-containing protein n=1 Tax=Dendryphion nanum TaxID=256645 RepID=A0A9P9EHF6_9PLEO|nr:hypothetical protein B0J11DRAFT_423338 [Dendryphion nanum]